MKKLLTFLLFFFILAFPAQAIEEFKTDYQINYLVNNRGQMEAEQEITLTNNFANIYPKEYLIETSQKVSNISAWDKQGNILKQVNQEEEQTKIRLEFNQEIIGKKESITFTLKYNLEKLAVRKGRVWEINLPQLSSRAQIDNLSVSVTVPDSFGKLAYSSVKIDKTEFLGNKTKFTLAEKNAHQAATLSFGDFQSFDFSLRYQLENPDSQPWKFLVAIPPLTNYQEVILTDLRPLPEKVELDENGNWLAVYYLHPQQTLPVLIEGQAKVFALPQSLESYNQADNLDLFLKEQEYWPVSNPKIIELANNLKTPEKIYNYVISSLSYNYQALSSDDIFRQGALAALENPEKSVCSEFTDLFVTLARAANIPAREIEGFAYTNNPQLKPLSLKKDVLHAWPEYWDENQKQWIQIDPTWEKTTGGVDYFDHFDFNHLTFVIHGADSNFPPPPGAYLGSGPTESKNITVNFAAQEVPLPPEQELIEKIQIKFNRGLNQAELLVKNNSLFPVKNIVINDQLLKLLPPWGQESVSIENQPYWQQFLFNPKLEVNLKLANYPQEKVFTLNLLSAKEATLRQIILLSLGLAGTILFLFLIFKLIKKVAKRG